jgi:hypothetical protein
LALTGALSRSRWSGRAGTRPVAVTFAGLLALGVGAYNLVDGVVVLTGGGDASLLGEGVFEIVVGSVAIALGASALRMRRWAWVGFMALAVLGLTQQLLRHFFYDHPNYVSLGLFTLAVFALTPLDVQVAFGIRPSRNVLLTDTDRNPIDSV